MERKQNVYEGTEKIRVVKDMRENNLSYTATAEKYNINTSTLKRWEQIYLEEGEQGLLEERRGRSKKEDSVYKGRPKKLGVVENESMVEELQRLKMENEYLKKLNALVQKRL